MHRTRPAYALSDVQRLSIDPLYSLGNAVTSGNPAVIDEQVLTVSVPVRARTSGRREQTIDRIIAIRSRHRLYNNKQYNQIPINIS